MVQSRLDPVRLGGGSRDSGTLWVRTRSEAPEPRGTLGSVLALLFKEF